jgi:hypothetical protein
MTDTDILLKILNKCSPANNYCEDCDIEAECKLFHDASDKLLVWQTRYATAQKKEKGEILDRFVEMTKYHRKYAAEMLSDGDLGKIRQDSALMP